MSTDPIITIHAPFSIHSIEHSKLPDGRPAYRLIVDIEAIAFEASRTIQGTTTAIAPDCEFGIGVTKA